MFLLFPVLASLLFTQTYFSFCSAQAPTVCNGHSEFCSRSYGNVTVVGAHDSYAIGVGNIAANQDQGITQQLNDGIRMLQVQAQSLNGTIQLCHTSCSLLNGGTLQSYLTTVKTWLDANPNEVLSLLIVNIDDLSPASYAPIFEAAELVPLSYAPPSSSPIPATGWPTLGSMISSGTRLVTFLDTGADFTSVPYLIDGTVPTFSQIFFIRYPDNPPAEFTNIWESAFDVTDTTFNCDVNRTKGDTSTQMFLINHFLDELLLGQTVPDTSALAQTNAVSGTGSLGTQVNTCITVQGRAPNFLLVDYYEFGGGSVFQVAAAINGVTYSPATAIATPKSSSTSAVSTPLNGAPFLDPNQGYAFLASAMAVMFGTLLVL